MKSKGWLMLFVMLILTVALGGVSFFGLGEGRFLSVHRIHQGLDLSGGVDIVYEADNDSVEIAEMDAAISLLQERMDWNGWSEAEVAREGEKRIRVQIPGVENAEEAIESIGQTAQLIFADSSGQVLLTGDMVSDAKAEMGTLSPGVAAEPYVSLTFNAEGKTRFAEATRANIGKVIYIVMDNESISAPIVQTVISDGQAMITGDFTRAEAETLASLIRAGSLPFDLNVIQMKNVGARLGADALQSGIFAGIVGFALVLMFMLITYKTLGIAAGWALVIYICLELAILSLFEVTLTLPGIAGIVLSIGMAVDANVVIYERIKEELTIGKTLRASVRVGFSRALSAILDGNITTLLAAMVLFYFGSGPIRGFATTLMIGILISMFTALVVARVIINNLILAGFHNPKYFGLRLK